LPDEILSKFPPTRMAIAGLCPLRDEQIKFVIRLAKLGIDIKAREYKYFPHCFISNAKSHKVPEFDLANIEILDTIEDLANL
jgi:acetyl esterase/lipase